MFRKILLGLMVCVVCNCAVAYAQGDFCNAVNTIMHDAPNKFRNIRGKMREANPNATIWTCGIKVPGTISSRFVASMGLFYEGGFLQTQDKGAVGTVYERCKKQLSDCLLPLGYTISEQKNFNSGLEAYKKLVFMLPVNESDATTAPIPAHVALEAMYSKELKTYTVVLYIFEH